MSNVRVLIVDDSAAMRALFGDILDQAKGVDVVGAARNADEARELIAECKPDVLTLDVEMPGMTGMEFLAEIMSTNPMPVVMLSSVTQEGTGTAQKARELGAVDVFPKPLHTSQDEFNATVNKLGEIVIAASKVDPTQSAQASEADNAASIPSTEFDGRIVVLAGSTHSIEVIRETIAAMPANCPPTIILVDADEGLVERAVDRLRPSVACKIEDAVNDSILVPGCVYLAYRKDRHIVIKDDYAPLIKLIERDPIGGFRPSADMLLASAARAGLPVLGGLLAADNGDGARGLDALAKAGAQTFVQKPDGIAPEARSTALIELGTQAKSLEAGSIPHWILSTLRKQQAAA